MISGQLPRKLQFHNSQQLLRIDRLNQKWGKLRFRQNVHLVLNRVQRHPRQQDHRECPPVLLHVRKHVKPIHVRHLQVEQNQVHRPVLQVQYRRFPVPRFVDLVPVVSQEVSQPSRSTGESSHKSIRVRGEQSIRIKPPLRHILRCIIPEKNQKFPRIYVAIPARSGFTE